MHSVVSDQPVQAGLIYGTASSTEFHFAVTDPRVRRLDYVAAATPDGIVVLGQVMKIERQSSLSFDQAMALGDSDEYEPDEKVSAEVHVVGFRDERGLLQVPRVPFRAATSVTWAPEDLIQKVLGLETSSTSGAYLGNLKGTNLPVHLHINTLVQKHISVLAKTGAGKSYCTGVLLEELMKKGVAIVIIDAHDEYHSLQNPNIDPGEIDRMMRFGLKPKAFAEQIDLWTTELNHRPGTDVLKIEGTGMSPNEIVELLGGKITGAQQGILYQAIKDARTKNPLYSLEDVIQQAHANKSNSKWNVISALEALDSTGFFADQGIAPEKFVQAGRTSIVSLKGVAPDVQEIIVARLATLLFESRKSTKVPPFLFVVEEAHNYCPERGIGSAVSSGVLRTIASEGRKFGMGLCVVSQRPAKVDKNVLSQCNTQIILKVTNPNDLKAIVGSVEGLTSDSEDEIARLPVGVALVAGGSLGMPVMVDVRTRQSRHGGASVDVVKEGAAIKPVPRAPKADKDVVVAPPAAAAVPPAPREVPKNGTHDASPKHERKERPPKEPEPLSERRIEWGVQEQPAAPAVVDEPVIREVPRKELAAKPAAPPTPPAPLDAPAEPRDVRVHRVANRVGYVATLKPEETLDMLRKAAARTGTPASQYIDIFAKIGRTHCFRDTPDCAPCIMASKCAFKAKRDAKAEEKPVGVLGRFLGRR